MASAACDLLADILNRCSTELRLDVLDTMSLAICPDFMRADFPDSIDGLLHLIEERCSNTIPDAFVSTGLIFLVEDYLSREASRGGTDNIMRAHERYAEWRVLTSNYVEMGFDGLWNLLIGRGIYQSQKHLGGTVHKIDG